jgi:Ran-binding protein 1
MADASTDPTHVDASSEPKLAPTETELATNPVHGDAKEEAAPAAVCTLPCRDSLLPKMSDNTCLFSLSNADKSYQTLTEQATSAATAAASTVTEAASGVADNVFSMFGGGAKKEKKDEDEDRGDNSGSAKAQKAAAAEENPEVCASHQHKYGLGAD